VRREGALPAALASTTETDWPGPIMSDRKRDIAGHSTGVSRGVSGGAVDAEDTSVYVSSAVPCYVLKTAVGVSPPGVRIPPHPLRGITRGCAGRHARRATLLASTPGSCRGFAEGGALVRRPQWPRRDLNPHGDYPPRDFRIETDRVRAALSRPVYTSTAPRPLLPPSPGLARASVSACALAFGVVPGDTNVLSTPATRRM
jgi:hypothetical protein